MPIKDEIQATIDKNDIVLFMKGTPDFPQCGFSGQVVEILNYLGVSYEPVNCLASDEIGSGNQGIFQLADIPSALRQGRIHWRLRYCPRNVSVRRTRGAFDGKRHRWQAAGQGLSIIAGIGYVQDQC